MGLKLVAKESIIFRVGNNGIPVVIPVSQ
jgi:hypothetical protein